MPAKNFVTRFAERQRVHVYWPEPLDQGFMGKGTIQSPQSPQHNSNGDRHGSLRRPSPRKPSDKARLALCRYVLKKNWNTSNRSRPSMPGDAIRPYMPFGCRNAGDVPAAHQKVWSHYTIQRDWPHRVAFDRRVGLKGMSKQDSDEQFSKLDPMTQKLCDVRGVWLLGSGRWQRDVHNPSRTFRKESLQRHEWKP